jgi:hypothetical protein
LGGDSCGETAISVAKRANGGKNLTTSSARTGALGVSGEIPLVKMEQTRIAFGMST